MGARLGLLMRLLLLMAVRCFMIGSVTIFLPGLLTSRGAALLAAAGALTLFELAGAGGALAAGTWSDRVGIRRVLLLAHIAIPPCLLAMTWSHGWTTSLLLIPAGVVVLSTGPVRDAVLASTALPGVFPPHEVEGRLYLDGGLVDHVPIQPAIDAGANTIYVLHVFQKKAKHGIATPKHELDLIKGRLRWAAQHARTASEE